MRVCSLSAVCVVCCVLCVLCVGTGTGQKSNTGRTVTHVTLFSTCDFLVSVVTKPLSSFNVCTVFPVCCLLYPTATVCPVLHLRLPFQHSRDRLL